MEARRRWLWAVVVAPGRRLNTRGGGGSIATRTPGGVSCVRGDRQEGVCERSAAGVGPGPGGCVLSPVRPLHVWCGPRAPPTPRARGLHASSVNAGFVARGRITSLVIRPLGRPCARATPPTRFVGFVRRQQRQRGHRAVRGGAQQKHVYGVKKRVLFSLRVLRSQTKMLSSWAS